MIELKAKSYVKIVGVERSIQQAKKKKKDKALNIFQIQIWHFNLKNMNNWLRKVTQVILSIQMSGIEKRYCTLIL